MNMVRLSVVVSDDELVVDHLPLQKTAATYWGVIAVTERGGWSGDALAELFARMRGAGGAWDLCTVGEIENVLLLLLRHLFKKSKAEQVEIHLSVFDSGSLFWLRPVLAERMQKLVREEKGFRELLFCWYVCSVERSLLPAEAATKSTLAIQLAAQKGKPRNDRIMELPLLKTEVLPTSATVGAALRRQERWLFAGIIVGGVALCAAISLFFLF